MASSGFYWYLDPGVIGQKFSVFAEELPFKLGTAVSEALDVAVADMRGRVVGLDRIRTGAMYNSISSTMAVTGAGRVQGNFGFIDAAPFYTLFQEYGTRRGIMAMHAFTQANMRLYETLKSRVDAADIWSNLRF